MEIENGRHGSRQPAIGQLAQGGTQKGQGYQEINDCAAFFPYNHALNCLMVLQASCAPLLIPHKFLKRIEKSFSITLPYIYHFVFINFG